MRELVDAFLDFLPTLITPVAHVFTILVLGLLGLKLIDSALGRLARVIPVDEGQISRIDHRTQTLTVRSRR